MPRESFNNLSQEKKNRIFSAAKIEFIRHPYEEVSINRVIKNAKISRGSFYLYFENKEDLYYFVLNENRNIVLDRLERSLLRHHTMFQIAEDLYDFVTSFVKTAEHKFFERVLANFTPQILEYYTIKIRKNENSRFDFRNLGDYDMLDINTPQDLTAMLEMVLQVTIYMIVDVYFERTSVENGRANLKRKLNLLKKACYKKS
jgi:AcrR family transcriptional regulator